MRKALLVCASVFSFAAACAQHQPKITTVILVRHAEKAGPKGDVPLSPAGVARANELARVLADADVKAIYTTPFLRTNQTVAPVAAALSVKAFVVPTGKSYAEDVARMIERDHPGETVLVVGHSDTTVDVLKRLGIHDARPIADTEFDKLFICTLSGGAARLTTLRYGAVSR